MERSTGPSRYANGEYLAATGGTWHADDGEWKARKIHELIVRDRVVLTALKNGHSPVRVVDIGCGSGSALLSLTGKLEEEGLAIDPVGVDPSPDALQVARRMAPTLTLVQGEIEQAPSADLMLLFDVAEHVPEPTVLLRAAARSARFVALNIPIEQSVYAHLTGLHEERFRTVGHLHFFHQWSALALLRNSNLEVLSHQLVSPIGERPSQTRKGRLYDSLQQTCWTISTRLTAHLLGSCSMIVLCRGALVGEEQSSAQASAHANALSGQRPPASDPTGAPGGEHPIGDRGG